MKESCDKLYLLYDALIGYLFPGEARVAQYASPFRKAL